MRGKKPHPRGLNAARLRVHDAKLRASGVDVSAFRKAEQEFIAEIGELAREVWSKTAPVSEQRRLNQLERYRETIRRERDELLLSALPGPLPPPPWPPRPLPRWPPSPAWPPRPHFVKRCSRSIAANNATNLTAVLQGAAGGFSTLPPSVAVVAPNRATAMFCVTGPGAGASTSGGLGTNVSYPGIIPTRLGEHCLRWAVSWNGICWGIGDPTIAHPLVASAELSIVDSGGATAGTTTATLWQRDVPQSYADGSVPTQDSLDEQHSIDLHVTLDPARGPYMAIGRTTTLATHTGAGVSLVSFSGGSGGVYMEAVDWGPHEWTLVWSY
jgi:hypothetical protein